MSDSAWSTPSRCPLPIVLVRGFGGMDTVDEQRLTYQGFNDGSVYPQKRGENYIYEGMILRFMKSEWRYVDATNVVGYYPSDMSDPPDVPAELQHFKEQGFFRGRVVIDPAMALRFIHSNEDPCRSLWVFRYYDLCDRQFPVYGQMLTRLIEFIRELCAFKLNQRPKVNIIAHSMGGLVVREAIQRSFPATGDLQAADRAINKVVTLGTPHKGITFQTLKDWNWLPLEASDELEHFNPEFQTRADIPVSAVNFHQYFPLERLLCVIGTNYKTYRNTASSFFNRMASMPGEFGTNYNRSDGLVKQTCAQIDGAPRTFTHKSHGGVDSIISARESFEIATRFLFGDVEVKLHQQQAFVTRGADWFGKSEFFFGVSVKPRGVDFDLFHQSREAENCYGPFRTNDFTDEELKFGWAGDRQLIWQGYLNSGAKLASQQDLVMRMEFYVSERDLYGMGFSDNVVFHKQYYVRAKLEPELELYLYDNEAFVVDSQFERGQKMQFVDGGWEFRIGGTGFAGTYRLELKYVEEKVQDVTHLIQAMNPVG
jgi:PGAP1-like protein